MIATSLAKDTSRGDTAFIIWIIRSKKNNKCNPNIKIVQNLRSDCENASYFEKVAGLINLKQNEINQFDCAEARTHALFSTSLDSTL